MLKIAEEVKRIIGLNIRLCRLKKFPGRGGSQRCAEAFGVAPQQWSPWETGKRTPNEQRLREIADFFGISVESLYKEPNMPGADAEHAAGFGSSANAVLSSSGGVSCPHYRQPSPGQPSGGDNLRNTCRLAECFIDSERGFGITFRIKDPAAINSILEECIRHIFSKRNP